MGSRWGIAPYFIVDDVVATANFYRDKLGFAYERFWGEPPGFCMVKRGGIIIMLSQFPKTGLMRPNRLADPNGEAWDAYVWVENADALCDEFKGKGGENRARDLRSALRQSRLRRRGLQRVQVVLWARHRRVAARHTPTCD